MPAVVVSNRRATPTTRLLTVDPGERRFAFRAGQWANLGLSEESAKPYSIASAPENPMMQFLIREDGSGLELSRARGGTPVYVEGPHGRFTLTDEVRDEHDVLFVAGGTGIAPVRSMLHETLRHTNAPHCSLVYSARDDREFAFLTEFRQIQRDGQMALSLVATRSAPSRWTGLSGRLTASVLRSLVVNADPLAFVCGPEGFVRDVTSALEDMGVTRIRTEEQ